MEKTKQEIIYILTNEAMPDYIKIGHTNVSLEERVKQLDRTNVPLPFEVHYACGVKDAHEDEKWLHSLFSDKRARDKREFFKMDPEKVVIAMKRIQEREIKINSISDATPEEQKEIDEKKKVQSRFDFAKYNIPVGSKIYFSRDKSIEAKVLKGNTIKLDGKETNLSKSAQELLGYKRAVTGTLYWMYEDEALYARRKRMDEGEGENPQN